VFLVCAGLGEGQTRGFVGRWAWMIEGGLNRRWRCLSDRFAWGRGCGLGRGAAAFDEWLSVRLSFEQEMREYSRFTD